MKIAPSILSVLNEDLCSITKKLEQANIEYLHLDVMDNQFVPNITFDYNLIKQLRTNTNLIFDTHLMIEEPFNYIKEYIYSGSDIITFHFEATSYHKELIKEIKNNNKLAGMSIKPNTKVEELLPYLSQLDLVLVMSVEPGFGGQKFQEKALEKVRFLKEYKTKHNLNYLIEIDGGINNDNYSKCKDAGCDIVVIGTYFFKNDNYSNTIKELENNENNYSS